MILSFNVLVLWIEKREEHFTLSKWQEMYRITGVTITAPEGSFNSAALRSTWSVRDYS